MKLSSMYYLGSVNNSLPNCMVITVMVDLLNSELVMIHDKNTLSELESPQLVYPIVYHQGPLLLTWINFNISTDK